MEVVTKIATKRIHDFYWKNNMCKFGLPSLIVSNNGIQFSSTIITDFCRKLGVQMKFVFVIHPHVNGQENSANKVISKGIKKRLDDAK